MANFFFPLSVVVGGKKKEDFSSFSRPFLWCQRKGCLWWKKQQEEVFPSFLVFLYLQIQEGEKGKKVPFCCSFQLATALINLTGLGRLDPLLEKKELLGTYVYCTLQS